jgi:aminocarboxymuconate-semialdehyde decarboxylase
MHQRMDRAAQGDVALQPPTAYVSRFAYDSILHHGAPLRFLAELAGSDRIMLGTDYSFPPADLSPLSTLAQAGLAKSDIEAIASGNAVRLFPRFRSRAVIL